MPSNIRPQHLRQMIAQLAARMIAEDGAQDYAHAKRKAARQLAVSDTHCLPTNSEIEQELRLHHEIFRSAEQPRHLFRLRNEALAVMRLLERFNPHLVGAVLEGTAGRYAETEIHLFADSLKDVELFLLNQGIQYRMEEKTYRFGNERRSLPRFSLEGAHGVIQVTVFATDDLRVPPKSRLRNGSQERADTPTVAAMVALNL
ncbi:MAG TPA: hypothetical protein PKW44_00475 [Methylophilaceae bacterium]|nr:hypothetical protein [Methylophilaceae bacterium]